MTAPTMSSPSVPASSPTRWPPRPWTSPGSTGTRRCRGRRQTSRPWPPTRCAGTPTRAPSPRCWASTAQLVDVAPASEVLGLRARRSSCMPGHRSAGTVRPGRFGAALMAGAALEGLVETRRTLSRCSSRARSVSLEPCHHRGTVGPMAGVVTPSMWMFVLEDLADRRAHALLAQRGPRQGAAVRRVLGPRCSPGWAGCATSSARCCRRAVRTVRDDQRTGRRDRDPDPDAADGRRGAQPQPGRHPDAAARPRPPRWSPAGRTPPTSRSRSGSSAATTTSSSTSRCPRASSRSTRRAAPRARRWWSRWPATAPTSGSRSPAPATSGSPGPPRWPTGSSSATTVPTTRTPTSATRRSPRQPGSAVSPWPRRRRSCGWSAAGCPTPSPPAGGCTRSRSARTPAGRSRSWSSRASRAASTSPACAGPGSSRRSTPGMAGQAGRGRPGRCRSGQPSRRDLPEGAGKAGRARATPPGPGESGLSDTVEIELDHVRLTALTWGPTEGPLAVLLHGFPDTAHTWRHLGPVLAAERLPGGGAVHARLRALGASLPTAHRRRRADGRRRRGAHGPRRGDSTRCSSGTTGARSRPTRLAAHRDSPFRRVVTMAVPPLPALPLRRDRAASRRDRPRRSWYVGFNQLPFAARALARPARPKALARLVPRVRRHRGCRPHARRLPDPAAPPYRHRLLPPARPADRASRSATAAGRLR